MMTKDKRAEEELRESEEKYRSLFENMLDGFAYCKILVDENDKPIDFVYLEVNDAFERLTGLKKEDVIGRRVTEAIPRINELHPELFRIYGKVALTGEPTKFDIYFEPLAIWLTISAYSPQRGYFVAVFDNITERKRAEQALRASEERYRSLVNNVKLGVFRSTSEPAGRFLEVNPAMALITGYSREELLKMNVSDLYARPEERVAVLEKIASATGKVTRELRFRRKDGTKITVSATKVAVRDDAGKIICFDGILEDITERKQVEKALSEYRNHLEELVGKRTKELRESQEKLLTSERLATLGQFSGSISHELRNPLGVIDSSVYYLKTKLKDADKKTSEHLDRIRSSVVSATAIIESLLDLTRMKEPQLKRLDLTAITSDAIATAEMPSTINVIQDFPKKKVLVNVDGEQLGMAFRNIIKNTVEAMDGKGTLTATVRTTADGQAEVSLADTGPGIAVENLDRVFQPLFSTKARGIGFGLSIARMVIDRHGGTIEAKSEPGKGANIIIRLPLSGERG